MKIVFLLGVTLLINSTNLAQISNFSFAGAVKSFSDEIQIFDNYKQLSIKDEKARLEILLLSLRADKQAQALILFRIYKNDSKKKNHKRFKSISEYFENRKSEISRLNLLFVESDHEDTIVYLQPRDVNLINFLYLENSNYKLVRSEELKSKINELFPKY